MVEYHGSTDAEELVSSFQSCNISYEEVFWEKKHSMSAPLHVDVLLRSLPSPSTTDTPPSSPVAFTVHNEERLPVEVIMKILWHASLPTLIAFKSTSHFWHSVDLDLPPTTARLWNCWRNYCYLFRHGWKGSSPGVTGVWELNTGALDRWITRFDSAIERSGVAARLPYDFVRFMSELPPLPSSIPPAEYLFMKRPSLPPSPPKSVPFSTDYPINIEPMYLLNHPSWYTEDMYVRHALTPTRYTDMKRPWFTKRDRKLFDRKYHLIRGTYPPPKSTKRLLHLRRISPSPTRGYLSDTSSDDGTPEWEKNCPEGPHAFGPNLIHFAQHTLLFSERVEEWPPAHILCVQIANLDPVRNTQRRASQPSFLLDIEIECLQSDDMAFLEWCIQDDGVEYHLVMAVEGEMQGYVFVEAERQLLTLVGTEWGEIYERWLSRCAGYISRNDDIAVFRTK